MDEDLQAAQSRAPAELEILLVENQLLGEAAELTEEIRADRECRAARIRDLARLDDPVCRIAVAAGPGEAAHVHDVAARVEEIWALEQAQPRLHDADTGIFEAARERGDSAVLRDRVGIQEAEHTGVGRGSTGVAARAEAVVIPRLEEPNALAPRSILDLRAAVAVVHDDDVDIVAAQRVEAASQRRAAVVRDDDCDRPEHALSLAAAREETVTSIGSSSRNHGGKRLSHDPEVEPNGPGLQGVEGEPHHGVGSPLQSA